MIGKKGLTKVGFIVAVLLSAITPSTIHAKEYTQQSPQQLAPIAPVIVAVLEFMTVKVAVDWVIDEIKSKYGEAYESLSEWQCRKEAERLDRNHLN